MKNQLLSTLLLAGVMTLTTNAANADCLGGACPIKVHPKKVVAAPAPCCICPEIGVGIIEPEPNALISNTCLPMWNIIKKDTKFQTFTELVRLSGLQGLLEQNCDQYTVFAPSDAAICAHMSACDLNALKSNKCALQEFVKAHIVPCAIDAEQLYTAGTFETLNGNKVCVRAQNGILYVQNSRMMTIDVAAGNGIINAIDKPMDPFA